MVESRVRSDLFCQWLPFFSGNLALCCGVGAWFGVWDAVVIARSPKSEAGSEVWWCLVDMQLVELWSSWVDSSFHVSVMMRVQWEETASPRLRQ